MGSFLSSGIGGLSSEGNGRSRGETFFSLCPSLPLHSLLILSFGFAFDAQCGYRSRHQPLFRDRFSTGLANSKCSIVDPVHGLLDFRDQLPLTVLDSQKEIPVRFQRGSVCWVGEVPFAVMAHIGGCLSSLHQEVMERSLEQSLKVEKLFLVH